MGYVGHVLLGHGLSSSWSGLGKYGLAICWADHELGWAAVLAIRCCPLAGIVIGWARYGLGGPWAAPCANVA